MFSGTIRKLVICLGILAAIILAVTTDWRAGIVVFAVIVLPAIVPVSPAHANNRRSYAGSSSEAWFFSEACNGDSGLLASSSRRSNHEPERASVAA